MGGIYGTTMEAFEQSPVTYYEALAGYDTGPGAPQNAKTVMGHLQCIERQTRNANGNLVVTRQMRFWTRQTLLEGWFIRDNDGLVYRIVKDNEWLREAGFNIYDLGKVVGDNGNADEDPGMSVGTGNFA